MLFRCTNRRDTFTKCYVDIYWDCADKYIIYRTILSTLWIYSRICCIYVARCAIYSENGKKSHNPLTELYIVHCEMSLVPFSKYRLCIIRWTLIDSSKISLNIWLLDLYCCRNWWRNIIHLVRRTLLINIHIYSGDNISSIL